MNTAMCLIIHWIYAKAKTIQLTLIKKKKKDQMWRLLFYSTLIQKAYGNNFDCVKVASSTPCTMET